MMDLNIELVRELYWGKNLSVNMIADFLGVGRTTVRRFMKRNGIPIRPIHDAMSLARKLGRLPQSLGWGVGNKNPNWRGGKTVTKYGYVRVKIYPDNPFYSMANNVGYVAEHRLVMAQHLGRPLIRWEHVHHKPPGDKADNRYENLKLTTKGKHSMEDRELALQLRGQVEELQNRVTMLEAENVLLKGYIQFSPSRISEDVREIHPFYEDD